MKTLRLSTSTFFFVMATVFTLARAQVYGHWEKTWRTPSTAKEGMNMGIAFSGENDVGRALNLSAPVFQRLQGKKYISIGGGNANGRWSNRILQDVNSAIKSGKFRQYHGIGYDVEEGDSGLTRDFEQSFLLAKKHGFSVLVTVSHSAPYGIDDGATVMRSFLSSRNIDYLSPQLYSTGDCKLKNHISTETAAVPWMWFCDSRPKIIPSLLHRRTYSYAKQFLSRHGVQTYGFIQWCA